MTITKEMQTIIERINNTPPQIFLTNDLDQDGLTPMCRLAKDLKSLLDLACEQHPQYQGEQQFSKGLDMSSIIFLLNVIKDFLSKGKKLEISPNLNDENFMISLKDGETSLQIDVVLDQNGVRLISAEVKDADGTIILNLKTDITKLDMIQLEIII